MNIRPTVDIERAAKMWADDISVRKIAKHFGISNGKMSGIMNRHREMFPKKTHGQMDRHTGKKASAIRIEVKNIHRARMEAAAREAEEFQTGTSEYLTIAPSDEERLSTAKELMDLERGDCRFPLNNGSPFLFCAADTDGHTYCVHHARRAYRLSRCE